MHYQLTYLTLPYRGLSVDFDQKIVAIGRASENDLVIEEPRVSGYHARIFMKDDQVYFEDVGSTNGSRVNGKRILRPIPIHAGDVIELGSKVKIRFCLLREAEGDRTLTDPPDVVPPSGENQRLPFSFPVWVPVLLGILILLFLTVILMGSFTLFQ